MAPHRSNPLIALCSMALLGGACSSGASTEPWTGTVEQRDGFEWVTNPETPLWPDDGQPRIALRLEQVFGADLAPTEAMLAGARDITVDDQGNVYVLDHGDNQLVAFDASGEPLWRAGREGEGPGEIQRPDGVVWNGSDRLYVVNQSGTRADVYSAQGDYLHGVSLSDLGASSRITSIGFVAPDRLYLLPMSSPEASADALRTGDPWTLAETIVMAAAPVVEMPGSARVGTRGRLSANSIAYGSVFDYEFRLFGLDGTPERVVNRPNTGFVPAAIDLENRMVASLGTLSAPVQLSDGRLLVAASWPTNISDPLAYTAQLRSGDRPIRETRYTLDLFDEAGRWLTGLQWDHPERPEHGTIMTMGPDGKLYTFVFDPFPQIRRYTVTIREPVN